MTQVNIMAGTLLNLFSVRPQYYKNGIWWFTKILSRLVGEKNWDYLRLARRAQSVRFYYIRQQYLYRLFVNWPDMAHLVGIYPKTDSSHGFPSLRSYQMYRDWQENTLNGDGSFSMWIYLFGLVYVAQIYYNYLLPNFNYDSPQGRGEEHFLRMRDAIASSVFEELCGNNYFEWAFSPHDFHYNKLKLISGYVHPDDPRSIHMNTLIRPNRYREHYISRSFQGHSIIE